MKYCLLLLIFFSAKNVNSQAKDGIDEFIEMFKLRIKEVVGKPLPGFKATGLDGKIYSNQNIRGKATFVNFWFESCHPCIAEIPMLNRLYNLYKDTASFQFYAITFETKENAERAMKKYNIQYPILLLLHDSAQVLNFKLGYPTNMILNKEGKISYITVGGSLDAKESDQMIEKYFIPELQKLLK
jgi:thiol-disulfide isomerase/thioredoxin